MDIDINDMTIEQCRDAATELLDSATGDLVGSDAQRFQALTARAEQLRGEQRVRADAGRDLVRRWRNGDLQRDGGDDDPEQLPVAAARHRDPALRVLDRSVKGGLMRAGDAETVERAINVGTPASRSWVARWAAATGSDDYLRAFGRMVCDPVNGASLFTREESEAWRVAAQVNAERAMSTSGSAGGYLSPMQLDPSILLSSDGSTDPLRSMARIVQCTGTEWFGVSSDGVDAHWYQEAAEASDDSPTLEQPSVPVYRGSAWVPFSVEIEGDGLGFVTEISRLLGDAVQQLQATAFVTGSGSDEPTGFVTALIGTASVVSSDGSEALAASDAYKLQNALPPRFQPNSQWGAALATWNTLRQFETSNGALKFPSLQEMPPTLLGRAANEISNMDSVINAGATESNYSLVIGDWSQFVIADRIGSTIELVPHVFGSNRRPTGQRGFFCWFRTGSDVMVDNAFRLLNVATTS